MHILARTSILCLIASGLAAQAAWTRLYPAQSPPAILNGLMACDEGRGLDMLLMGSPAQFWSWDGTTWQSLSVAMPPDRGGAGMVWDAARQRIVMFGGINVFTPRQDLWEWDGSAWSQRITTVKPSAREGHGMAYDRQRNVTVLFGGVSIAGFESDTWEWDGTAWHAVTTGTQPSARHAPAMAFDPNTESVMLFGGVDSNSLWMTDTWLWNGSTWIQQFPNNQPFPRASTHLASDLHRRRVVLFGESNVDPFPWEWDGSNWSLLPIASPGVRIGFALDYDAVHREVVLFGGVSNPAPNMYNDTWVYRTASPATFTSYGNGCAGVPVLSNAPYSLPWLGDTFRARATSLASATSTVVFATSVASTLPIDLAPYGMPGCYSLVDTSIIALDFVAANAGAAEWSIAVPNSTALNGAHVFQQAIALEAGANAAGAIVSNAGDIGVGIR